ncbi:hypothetical protein H1R20_g2494, partial [Candolleomyces eurysporus]
MSLSFPGWDEGYILPDKPKGSIQLDFSSAYLAPNPDAETTTSDRAVILLTDDFGLPLKNPKLIADALAERLRCDVWVPDYFNGLNAIDLVPQRVLDQMTTWDKWRLKWKTILPFIGAFWDSSPSVVDKRLASFIALLKEKKGYKKIGAVGYSYGGAACIRLASTGLIDCAVICHPNLPSPSPSLAQVRAICVPVSWVCAESDHFFSNSIQHQCKAELAGRKGTDRFVEFEFNEYKGTVHGFACRPNLEYPLLVESCKYALDQTASWFEKTLVSES